MLKSLIQLYEQAMYASSVAYGEFNKMGTFVRDTLLIVTALGVRGYKPRKWQIGVFFAGLVVVSVIGGVVLIRLRVPQYNNSINNQQNPQLLEIISTQKEILNKIK